MHIQEKKGHEKTSSPEPEVKKEEVPQKETEVESGLETKEPDTSKTIEDLKDKPELDDPKKESPQKEINGSAVNKQVSNEYIHDIFILPNTQILDEQQVDSRPTRHSEKVWDPILEQVYTTEILGNTLTWGDQQIPDPVDEVTNIHVISYDQNRKVIVQRTPKKRSITLDHSILVTTEENLINIVDIETSEILRVGKALSNATLDRAKR